MPAIDKSKVSVRLIRKVKTHADVCHIERVAGRGNLEGGARKLASGLQLR